MGRRRKHDGDSGLASDQIPGQNQNNTSISLVTLYCTTTRPFAVVHGCTVAHERTKCKPDEEMNISIGCGIGHGPLREQGDGMQAVEMQRRFSSHQQTHLT